MMPVRCFSCNKVLKEQWVSLSITDMKKVLTRSCCRRMCLSAFDTLEAQLNFSKVAKQTLENGGVFSEPDKRKEFSVSGPE